MNEEEKGLYYYTYEYNDNGGAVKGMDWEGKRPDKWHFVKSEFYLSRKQAEYEQERLLIHWGKDDIRNSKLFFIPATMIEEKKKEMKIRNDKRT